MPTINNRFENLTLERLQEIYDLIITPGSIGLAVGVTPITGGAVGRVLFEGAGNVLQESSNLFWDQVNNRLGVGTASPVNTLDVNGTARVLGQTTIAGAVNASSGFVRGTFFNQTLVATANNDTLYGIDINPTYTVGAFTGVTLVPLRIRNAANTANAFYVDGNGNATLGASLSVTSIYAVSNINLSSGNGNLLLQTNFTGNTGLTMFNSTRNVVIQNGGTFTDAGYRLDINGTARTQGLLTATGGITSGITAYNMSVSTNQVFYNDTTKVIQSPATWIWHDLFAFNRLPVTYETYNGTTWSAATANLELFAQKQSQTINVISTTVLASRWTFSSTDWGGGQWLVLGVAYAASLASATILFESWNGTTWTTRHTSTVNTSANNVFCYVTAYSGDSQLRLTITRTGGGTDLNLSNIRFLTARPGDQGAGMELESPIYWNGTRNVGVGNVALSNTRLLVGGSVSASGLLGAGTRIVNTISATANNDVLVGLDIAPTFTNGAFTGVSNIPLRIQGSNSGAGITFSNQNWAILNTSNQGFVYNGNVGFDTYSSTGTPIRFFQTGVLRLSIAATTGNVLINTSTDVASSKLTIESTTQGVLIPRMTSTQRDAITSPAVGLQIFNTTTSCVEYYDTFWGWMPVSPTNEWYSSYGFNYFNDAVQSDGVMGAGTSGAGASINGGANILGANGPGNATFITGTTATGTCRIGSNSYYAIGGGRILQEYRCGHVTLSTASERYTSILGFQDVFGSPNQVDGVFFLYDEGGVTSGSTASPNWQCVTSSNSVRTFTTTSIPVDTNQRKLRFTINDAGTQVLFYIDNVLVATHTTNIPTGTSRNALWGAMVTKSVGITSTQALLLDYISFKTKFTTPR